MTFVAGFYSFIVELSDIDHGRYTTLRFKLARHPDESDEFLVARTLAYIHSYQEDLKFTRGLFEAREPALWRHSPTEEILDWIEVGIPPRDKIERALRHHSSARFAVYFHAPEQIAEFCYFLRGSKTNWVEPIAFFLLDRDLLESLAGTLSSSNRWSVTLSENTFFVTIGSTSYEGPLKHVDIWEEYQHSLGNPS
jgi:uncharacterized protein YaeQ